MQGKFFPVFLYALRPKDIWWGRSVAPRIRNHVLDRLIVQLNLYAPRFLYIGQAFRYSPENAFCIFNQQIYFII